MNLLTVQEAASRIHASKQAILRAIRAGKLEAHKPAGKYLIPEDKFWEWVTHKPERSDPGVYRPRAKVATSSFERRLQAIESNTEAA